MQTDLREIASPFLQDLYAATLATVHLAVRDGTEALYLDRLSGKRSVPGVSRVGARLPLHATGVGKVLLAYAPHDVRRAVLSSLTRVTPYTITQSARLSTQLDALPADGYATTVDEMTIGACSGAVPIRRDETDVVAALGIVVPSLKRDKQRLVSALTVTAHGIGRTLTRSPLAGRGRVFGEGDAVDGCFDDLAGGFVQLLAQLPEQLLGAHAGPVVRQ